MLKYLYVQTYNKELQEKIFVMFCCVADVLTAGGRSDLSEGTLVELWLQNGPSYMDSHKLPLDRTQLEAETNYNLQNCVPTMGET